MSIQTNFSRPRPLHPNPQVDKLLAETAQKKVRQMIGTDNEVLCYGFAYCGWNSLHLGLAHMGYQVKCWSSSGWSFDYTDSDTRRDKNLEKTLTCFVLENYLRTIRKDPKLPKCLFCINSNDFKLVMPNIAHLTQREVESKHTFRELKRVYSLCFDPDVDQRIRAVARQSFVFLEATVGKRRFKKRVRILDLKEIDPPWPNVWCAEKEEKHTVCPFNSSKSRMTNQHPEELQDWKDQVNAVCAFLDGKTTYEPKFFSKL